MEELLNSRSDQHAAKRILYNNIIENGESDIPDLKSNSNTGTQDLFKVYMIGLGLNLENY